jgi:hypothetical protein
VSDAVLDSLARVFLLTDKERGYLYALANKSLPERVEVSMPVNDGVARFFDKLDSLRCPAYITDSHWNFVKWNRSAAIVFGDFSGLPADERNAIYQMFFNREHMSIYDRWDVHAKEMVIRFHATFARHITDPWFSSFIDNMKSKSDFFANWWALYDVNSMTNIVKDITHPTLGKLTFDLVCFDVFDNQNLSLLVYNPDDKTYHILEST